MAYHDLHYRISWGAGEVMTRFGAELDKEQVLHHAFLFSTHAPVPPGTVVKHSYGTTLFTDARLIAGWIVGGCGQEFPPEVGMWLPDPGDGHLMVQWHHLNTTGQVQLDRSKLWVCTVPVDERTHVGGLTLLGTEFDGHRLSTGMSSIAADCVNTSAHSAFVVGWMPHMHSTGVHMRTEVERLDGTIEAVFDRAFKPDYQVSYPQRPAVQIEPGERLITTCSYRGDRMRSIGFGESVIDEMCYQLTSYYPVGALVNGASSVLGPLNTCWGEARISP